VWTLALWKPLQRFRLRLKNKPAYDSLIGGHATVHGSALVRGREGQVLWSGTIMSAEIAPDAGVETIPPGARVVVADVRGALVLVHPSPT
jgi:membrane protein implicated in regulation of membrane protease activity